MSIHEKFQERLNQIQRGPNTSTPLPTLTNHLDSAFSCDLAEALRATYAFWANDRQAIALYDHALSAAGQQADDAFSRHGVSTHDAVKYFEQDYAQIARFTQNMLRGAGRPLAHQTGSMVCQPFEERIERLFAQWSAVDRSPEKQGKQTVAEKAPVQETERSNENLFNEEEAVHAEFHGALRDTHASWATSDQHTHLLRLTVDGARQSMHNLELAYKEAAVLAETILRAQA